MYYKIFRQPDAIAGEDHHAINACCKKACVYLYNNVVDYGPVCGDTFGSLDTVDTGRDFETVEWNISCQGINGDAVSRGRWPDVVEAREEVEIWHVGQERQSSKVSTYKAKLRIVSPSMSGILHTVKASEPSNSQLGNLPTK